MGDKKDLTYKEMLEVWKTRLQQVKEDRLPKIRGKFSFSNTFKKEEKIDYINRMITKIKSDEKDRLHK